jgi:hypothetical protein
MRQDLYAEQSSSGNYYVRHSPISEKVLTDHLFGRKSIGFYALSPDSKAKWAVLDSDKSDGLESLSKVHRDLKALEIPSCLEKSRRGGHLWVFFSEPLPANAIRQLIIGTVPDISGFELYPKQDHLSSMRPLGSLVRAPLGIHRKSKKRYPFIDPETLKPVGSNLREQLEYLKNAEKLSVFEVAFNLASQLKNLKRPTLLETGFETSPSQALTRIEKLKGRIGSTKEFLDLYLIFDEKDRTHCPFHPPNHKPSFYYFKADDRWFDFHDHKGGDAIDFYQKISQRGLTRKQVIEELEFIYSFAA